MAAARALALLARPAGALLVPLLPLSGYGFAHWHHALSARNVGAIIGVALAWICLHAGTMWLNAALDRDTGEVLFGRAIAVPEASARCGYAALCAAVLLAAAAHPLAALCAVGCAGMSVAYSHPRIAAKGHAVAGPLINVAGYGVLSPLAGFVVVGRELTGLAAATGVLLAFFAASFFLAAQAFQEHEDRGRGYRTLVALRGPGPVLRLCRLCWWCGAIGVALLALAGWFPRALVLSLPAALWVDRWIAGSRYSSSQAQRFAWRGMSYALFLVALAYVEYLAA